MRKFDFQLDNALSRNLGWITTAEASVLKNKTVAIAGCGGVGGHYAEIMARSGIGKFHLADPDVFEAVNFNRQNASGISTVGLAKVEVIRARILDINPHAEVTIFSQGVNSENREEFLSGVDLYLDGLDFFVINERIDLFEALQKKGIPAITAAPTGMGTSLLVFDSKSMSFSQYFGLHKDQLSTENSVRFLVGLTPALLQRKYQADRSKVDFANHKVPSTAMGCYLCAGVVGTTALKILLERGPVKSAPWSHHFDAYTLEYKKSYTLGGANNPLQILKRWLVHRMLRTDRPKINSSAIVQGA